MRAVEKLLASKRLLAHLSRDYAPIALYQSFSMEDMVLAHLIYDDLVHREFENVTMLAIDTGRLPEEIHSIMDQLRQRYGDVLKVYHPDHQELEQLENEYRFHNDYQERSYAIRLLNPLSKALQHYNGWITGAGGLTEAKNNGSWITWDNTHQIPCFNPLSRWTPEEIHGYVKHHGLPVHESMAALSGHQPDTGPERRWRNPREKRHQAARHIA
ncbi:MAG: phosphoadenosine phosphosulfate reductase family protein [Gammaproteobacteria bacterium]|jgi:phosphoadenosine phosphosulfate reductase